MRSAHRVVAIVALSLGACRLGEPGPPAAPPPATGLPSAEPTVAVGITVDSAAAIVGATTDFEIREAGGGVVARGGAGERWTFTADADGRITGRGPGGATQPRATSLRVVPSRAGGLTIGGRQYRGEALILARPNAQVTAVNVVDLEAYLLGVVPREIGRLPASQIEAIKAQAVAARTYAIGNLRGRQSRGFDFYATVLDQVYGGMQDEDSVVNRAVAETRGEIMTYNGTPILAYYSSTCGGATANIEDSWPNRTSLPYLRGVSDRIPGTDRYYCDTSNRFSWTTRWTRDQLLAVLGETLRAHTGGSVSTVRRIDDVRLAGRNASDRATVEIVADGTTHTLRADSVRWVLRPQPGPAILNSSKLEAVEATRDAGGVSTLEIRGGGWGHAIGMCQVGAINRARMGQSHRRILQAYYTGVQIQRLF
ncbi:MAG TPA: SpoIID/LytB domain-containing protein [Longimicrobiales bacterium]|nr:SpoIID/LytB domain-containing protein [Longimicrobiales bacterium]